MNHNEMYPLTMDYLEMDHLTMDHLEIDCFTKDRKEKVLQIISAYSTKLEDVDCPFLWQLSAILDKSDFKKAIIKYSYSASDFDNEVLSNDYDSQTLMIYGVNRIAKITCQYFAYGPKDALATLASFIQTLAKVSIVPKPGIDALFYIARSSQVILHLLNDEHVKGFELKESLRVIDDPEEIGHIQGIRGMFCLLFNTKEDGAPFLRCAITATNRNHQYVFELAKTIARKRRLKCSKAVIAEEIELFAEVAEKHTYAIPQLLCSLNDSIHNMKKQHSPYIEEFEKRFNTALENAWDRKELFTSLGLTRLATQFKFKGQFSKAEELYEMAYEKNPNCGMNLHQYGTLLIKSRRNIDEVKKGFGYLVRAGHIPAFITLLDLYFKPDSIFKQTDFFLEYLDQFVSFAHIDTTKRLYSYIAYNYFMVEGDFQKSVNYLKTAVSVNLDDLKFDFRGQFKTVNLPTLKKILRTNYIRKECDLSYDIGSITDLSQIIYLANTELPLLQIVNEFKAWCLTTMLKPMSEYEGFSLYLKKRGDTSNCRSPATLSPDVCPHSSTSYQLYSSSSRGRPGYQSLDQGHSTSNWRQSQSLDEGHSTSNWRQSQSLDEEHSTSNWRQSQSLDEEHSTSNWRQSQSLDEEPSSSNWRQVSSAKE